MLTSPGQHLEIEAGVMSNENCDDEMGLSQSPRVARVPVSFRKQAVQSLRVR